MTDLRSIIGTAMVKAAALSARQIELNNMRSPAQQKAAVMRWHGLGILSKEDTQLLFEVYSLAEA